MTTPPHWLLNREFSKCSTELHSFRGLSLSTFRPATCLQWARLKETCTAYGMPATTLRASHCRENTLTIPSSFQPSLKLTTTAVYSLYWAMATLTSTGYGELSATNVQFGLIPKHSYYIQPTMVKWLSTLWHKNVQLCIIITQTKLTLKVLHRYGVVYI